MSDTCTEPKIPDFAISVILHFKKIKSMFLIYI